MNRQFFTRHPETGEPILLIQGESGYYPISISGIPAPRCGENADADTKLAALNGLFKNTAEDLEIAIACSMFGWHIPLAENLS